MRRTIRPDSRPGFRRRGVTLVEMLVTVAMLVIIMTILVQVFQAATGALSSAQKLQQIDDQLRRVDSLIRSDLEGVTARFTPPLDPAQNLGYFEYGENEFADLQGEDSDDYIRFTAKAPEGRPFTGRMWVPFDGSSGQYNANVQPVTVTSDFAEIIYFLRNGNLYRRVLLVAPQLQSTIAQPVNNQIGGNYAFYPAKFGNVPPQAWGGAPGTGATVPAGWQGVNDLSARPAGTGNTGSPVTLNTLGDLTNRENRAFMPRFANDYWNTTTGAAGTDGIPDDLNNDNIPDSYPSLYSGVFSPTNPNVTGTWQLTFEPAYTGVTRQGASFFTMAFPYIFPGSYSVPQTLSANTALYGWIHSPSPYANVAQGGTGATPCQLMAFDQNPLAYLQSMNHNPVEFGDNLPTPTNPAFVSGGKLNSNLVRQTWWGFPTWRETLSANWNDPTVQVNVLATTPKATVYQPNGLSPRPTNTASIVDDGNGLPWMDVPQSTSLPTNLDYSIVRPYPQPFSDATGYQMMSLFLQQPNGNGTTVDPLWYSSWDDDLVMTGVRSFDIKAYDNSLAGFADLGWGDDARLATKVLTTSALGAITAPAFLAGNPDFTGNTTYPQPPVVFVNGTGYDYINYTLMHEGRMPPLVEDNRLDYQYPNPSYINYSISPAYLPYMAAYPTYTSNIGDDSTGIVRLRRVWDTWSTEYSKAPAVGVASTAGGSPVGPPFSPPVYPSYPPPYPAPLRGIQIQIRAVDPTNQKIKSLTIRQDFSDKL